MRILTHRVGDLYSIIDSQTIYCHLVPKATALAVLQALDQPADALEVEADPGQWRATFLTATVSELDRLKADVAAMMPYTVGDKLNARIEQVAEFVNLLADEIRFDRQAQLERDKAAWIKDEVVRRVQALRAAGVEIGAFEVRMIREQVEKEAA